MNYNSFDTVQSFSSCLDNILNYHLPHYLDECCHISVSKLENDLFDIELHFECDKDETNLLIHFINTYHNLINFDIDYSLNFYSKYPYYDLFVNVFDLNLESCGLLCVLFIDLLDFVCNFDYKSFEVLDYVK